MPLRTDPLKAIKEWQKFPLRIIPPQQAAVGSFPHWDRGCCSISSTNQYLGIRGQTTLSVRTLAAGGVRVKAHYGQQRDNLIPRWVTPRKPSGDPSTWTHQQPRQKGWFIKCNLQSAQWKAELTKGSKGNSLCGMWYSEGKQAWLRDMILQVAGSEQLRDRVKAWDTQVVGSMDLKKLCTFLSLFGV